MAFSVFSSSHWLLIARGWQTAASPLIKPLIQQPLWLWCVFPTHRWTQEEGVKKKWGQLSWTRLEEKVRERGDWWKESMRWGGNQTGGTKRYCEIIKDKVRSLVRKGKTAERSPYLYLDRTAERDSASSEQREKIFRTEGEQGDIHLTLRILNSQVTGSSLGLARVKGHFTPISKIHIFPLTCFAVYPSRYIMQQEGTRQSSTFEELNCNFSFQKSWCKIMPPHGSSR